MTPATINHQPQPNRKPSFKFEGTMLSRVQTMNVNKIKCLNEKDQRKLNPNNKSKINFEFDEETIEAYKTVHDLNNDQKPEIYQKITPGNSLNKRQPSQLISPNSTNFSNSYSLSSSNSHFVNILVGDKSTHQISLDSGIYLPSE